MEIMKLASIDIGSNSVLLLIAEYDSNSKTLKTLRNEYKISRLAENLNTTGKISEKRIITLTQILKSYVEVIKFYSCSEVIVTGSFALRNAKNSKKIKEIVNSITGKDLKIIQQNEEALFSFLGAAVNAAQNGLTAVIDIGGGSTEIAVGENQTLIDYASFELGVVTLFDMFSHRFPFDEITLEQIRNYIYQIFDDAAVFNHKQIKNVFAVAGTPTSLSAIKSGMKDKYFESEIEGSEITTDDIKRFINVGSRLGAEELIEEYGSILKGRADLLIYGSIILSIAMEKLKTKSVKVSGRGVRYGAVIKHLANKGYIINKVI